MDHAAQTAEELSPLKHAYLALERAQDRVAALQRARNEAIAVLGIGCRLPGGVKDAEGFWRLLSAGQDAIAEVPGDRWDINAYYDPDPDAPGKIATRYGGFLDEIAKFDAAFFGIAPREAQSLDPQQRLLLEVAVQALEDAAVPIDRLHSSCGGVFVGISTADYCFVLADQGQSNIDAYFGTGICHNTANGRLSYFLGMEGPSVAVDTACSSSLAAVHLACQSLRNGECDLALVGGVNLMLTPELSISFSKARMLCGDGRCKTFSAAANGYVRGEGAAVVVLKRLSDALSAGDRVRSVIRGSAVNQDGPSGGLTVPNGLAQQAVIRRALAQADLQPNELDYIEAHGTGTALGDPIEIGALGEVFGDRSEPLWVGSVKTNVGHLEAAAGIAGLIKVVLTLEHEEIPPHLHFDRPSPHIPWTRLPVKVPTQPVPWPRSQRRRRAGVSSFGFSGTNVHVVLEEAPAAAPTDESFDENPSCRLVTVSAKSREAMQQLAGQYARHWEQHPRLSLADFSLTSTAGRSHYRYRGAVAAKTADEALAGLRLLAQGGDGPGVFRGEEQAEAGKIAMVFSGQGSQYAGMGRELYDSQPVFRMVIDYCGTILRDAEGWQLQDVLFAQSPSAQSRLDQTGYTQPALFALEYALAELWESWGIRGSWLMGHSVGEYVAACLAGIFSLEEGLRLIAARGRLMQDLPPGGRMVAIWAEESVVLRATEGLEEKVSLAAVNGPGQVVLSGQGEAVEAVVDRLGQAGVRTQDLRVSHAFHSPLMEPMLEGFAPVAAGVEYQQPRRWLVSNLSGQRDGSRMAQAQYWCDHVRRPVRFAAGMQTLFDQGARVFLEVGPQSTLLGLGRACWEAGDWQGRSRWLGSLHPKRSDAEVMLGSLAEFYKAGEEIDWIALSRGFPGRKVPLPTYPFERKRYWVQGGQEPRKARPHGRDHQAGHPLLGSRQHAAAADEAIRFEVTLAADKLAYLAEHRLAGAAVLPATAYLEMGLAAARRTLAPGTPWLADVVFEQVLVLDQSRVVQVVLRPDADGFGFEIHSRAEDSSNDDSPQWTRHVHGRLGCGQGPQPPAPADINAIEARCHEIVSLEGFYELLREKGLEYGPSFQGLNQLRRAGDGGEVLGRVELASRLREDRDAYVMHPAMLDACLHALAGGMAEEAASHVPARVARVEVWAQPGPELWTHGQLHRAPEGGRPDGRWTADVELLSPTGSPLAKLTGLEFQRVNIAALVGEGRPTAAADDRHEAAGRGPAPPLRSLDVAELKGLSSDQLRRRITVFLEQQIAAALGLSSTEPIDAKKSFFEMGMDSLMGVDFLYRINRGLKMNLPAQRLLDKPYLPLLAEELVQDLRGTSNAIAQGEAIPAARDSAEAAPEEPDYSNVWLPGRTVRPGARVRLFCWHDAAGTAAMFDGWGAALPPAIEVCPVELPGQGTRAGETPIDDRASLLDTLCDALLDSLDRPFALFGHGDGAWLALEFGRRLKQRFGLSPAHLFVGDAHPPETPSDSREPLEASITVLASKNSGDEREDGFQWRRRATGSFRFEPLSNRHGSYRADLDRVLGIISRDLMQVVVD